MAPEAAKPPTLIGPDTNVKWKVAVPNGLSSPIVAGDYRVLTAFDGGKLYTIAYQRTNGAEAWRSEISTFMQYAALIVAFVIKQYLFP